MGKLPFEKLKRKILIKRESETNDNYGQYPAKISVENLIKTGIVVIDKPKGPTSHQVADYVKKILGVSKAGHSGTLDPGVSGVLPIALEESTKVVSVLLPAGKEYVALAHFHKEHNGEEIRKEFDKFIGKIIQLPPVKSAIKRQERERTIYYMEIMEIEGKDVLFKVGCQAGTYIRKLIHDIGRPLGGAHMAELRRTKAGPFSEENMINLQELSDSYHFYKKEGSEKIRDCIKNVESAVSHLSAIYVLDTAVDALCRGADLKMPGVSKLESCIKKGNLIAIFTLKGELICIGHALRKSIDILEKEKGKAVKTFRVFMKPDTYPRIKNKI